MRKARSKRNTTRMEDNNEGGKNEQEVQDRKWDRNRKWNLKTETTGEDEETRMKRTSERGIPDGVRKQVAYDTKGPGRSG